MADSKTKKKQTDFEIEREKMDQEFESRMLAIEKRGEILELYEVHKEAIEERHPDFLGFLDYVLPDNGEFPTDHIESQAKNVMEIIMDAIQSKQEKDVNALKGRILELEIFYWEHVKEIGDAISEETLEMFLKKLGALDGENGLKVADKIEAMLRKHAGNSGLEQSKQTQSTN